MSLYKKRLRITGLGYLNLKLMNITFKAKYYDAFLILNLTDIYTLVIVYACFNVLLSFLKGCSNFESKKRYRPECLPTSAQSIFDFD